MQRPTELCSIQNRKTLNYFFEMSENKFSVGYGKIDETKLYKATPECVMKRPLLFRLTLT